MTTSLEVPRKIIIPIAICYPSRIFGQVMKINKRKYMSYSTSVTWGFMRLKRLDIGLTAFNF